MKLSDSNILSEDTNKLDNGGYASESKCNFNDNTATAISLTRAQPIITNTNVNEFLDESDVTLPKPLDVCTEDLSDIGPYLTPTFSFAKYANKSRTIQELVKLGVELYKLELKEGMVQYILGLDFDADVKPYITFLHDCGVPANHLGFFITKNPDIFKEDMNNLHTRIRYLRAHDFNIDMISTIICKNPKWLLYSTKNIDGRLGYFQSNFQLTGHQIRFLAVKGPKIVTYKMLHLMSNTFTIKEEMGFNIEQTKKLLLKMPKLWVKSKYTCMKILSL